MPKANKLSILIIVVIILVVTLPVLYLVNTYNINFRSENEPFLSLIQRNIETKESDSPYQEIYYKASFSVYTNGTKRGFNEPEFLERDERAYMTESEPDVIRIKKTGITWGQFFETLPIQIYKDCLLFNTGYIYCNTSSKTVKFYINGLKEDNALDLGIRNGDRLLITYGHEDDSTIEKQIKSVPDPKVLFKN